MLRVMWRNLFAHKGRLVRTIIAVMLGVSFVSGTYILTDTLDRVFDDISTETTEGIDIYVRGHTDFEKEMSFENDRPPVPEGFVSSVRSVDGVEEAYGSMGGPAVMFDKDGEPISNGMAPAIGMSWSPITAGQIVQGRSPNIGGEVVVDSVTAEDHGIEVGRQIEIATVGPSHKFRVVGIYDFGHNLAGATLAIFDLDTAQREFDREGELDYIEVRVEEEASIPDVRAGISEVVPAQLEAISASTLSTETADRFGTFTGFFQTALLIFAVIALFVGAFIIFNTFGIIVAQRTKEFSLLRAVGASTTQLTLSVLGEALIVGLVASFLGLIAGFALAAGLKELLAAFGMDLPNATLQFLPRTVYVSMGLGVIVTAIAALGPARRAANIPPLAAMREAGSIRRSFGARTAVGLIFGVGGAVLLALGLFVDVVRPMLFVGAGAMSIFLGVAALSPLITKPIAGLIAGPIARLSGISGKLARENTIRQSRRTATTAAALMIGVALVSFVAIFASSIRQSAMAGLDDSLKADYIVSNQQMGMNVPFSPKVALELAKAPEIEVASPLRSNEVQIEGALKTVGGVDAQTVSQVLDLGVTAGRIEELRGGGIAISEKVAEERDLQIGDRLDLWYASTGHSIAGIDAIYDNGAAVGVDYLIGVDVYEMNFTQPQDVSVFVKGAPGVPLADVEGAVEGTIAGFPSLHVMDQAEMRAAQAQQIDQLLGMISALLGLAIIVAIIGIGNTLSLSVLERTRELGLLRAVGMSRTQVRSLVRWEALIIALFGAVLGLAVGVLFGWAVVTALSAEGIDHLSFPFLNLAIYLAAAGLAGVLAARGPARRASKLDILRAIASE
jgi:putative ABC transport system permease protein